MRCPAFLPGSGWAPGRDLNEINCNKGAEVNMKQGQITVVGNTGRFFSLKNKDLIIKKSVYVHCRKLGIIE